MGPSPPTSQIVTSFSSKSELGLNISKDGRSVTFMGYLAGVNQLDVSNANTPGAVDPTNPVRTVARGIARSHLATGRSTSPPSTPTAATTAAT